MLDDAAKMVYRMREEAEGIARQAVQGWRSAYEAEYIVAVAAQRRAAEDPFEKAQRRMAEKEQEKVKIRQREKGHGEMLLREDRERSYRGKEGLKAKGGELKGQKMRRRLSSRGYAVRRWSVRLPDPRR